MKFEVGNRFKKRAEIFVEFGGQVFTKQWKGYWRASTHPRIYLHQAVWIQANGTIPKGFDVHHLDGNKDNNEPSNLKLEEKPEHGRRHHYTYTEDAPF